MKKYYGLLLLLTCTIILIIQRFGRFPFFSKPQLTYSYDEEVERLEDFVNQWCASRHVRGDWELIQSPCKDQTEWESRKKGWDKKTDAKKSVISEWDIRPAGISHI